ncbi:Ser/Thr protein kinase RdoA (MazF antagonist) [Dyadobacter sp. BE34]|uniref:Ser/Thr protein kinase RdoA (MazF antagonist) n=1 Tax=Dyadobacter fermentans TaxID=94254 RepID=A0ABU1QYU0_9BACT|nr:MULTISPECIES: phosphotransferase [Dyadobacter]MDR6806273.1 Ser/Thr protein kinase RdoA (MazF antagonist) [Dyadobacter fermentans]MDR7044014.1 Ser/Thr protein kinase RdoA (MazF antagonist) [Dyadobacter sp. BE242]MDR7198325.1 Ser/Thr protein kinase RdoA (MazF antagonist) [Dyadobacter sp. BE34]MDR7216287.1 Ser/Thr protein kinase RdoA (MazF antagonist) [Dyadobacter sp. BE31]MDR7264187.1 Ser/Thr protein kinase RdoA (MazF antagonist) [Dyadobacter sp. BE32]
MNIFPVSNSNLSPVHLGDFIQKHYFPEQQVECRILKTGISDTYLIVASDKRYIFRVYSFQWRTWTEISEELRLLEYLRQNGVSVSYPIADLANAFIHTFQAPEGERFGVLFSFAEGEKVLNFDSETHYRVGKLMAEMHLLAKDFPLQRVAYTEKELLIDSLGQLSKFLPADTEEMQYMKTVQEYLIGELQNADRTQLRKGAVHLDLWFDNMNVTTDGGITFFDFDFCGNGWLCLDMAYYMLQIHSTEKDDAERELKTEQFLKGYESVTPVSDEEKRLIPMLGICLYFFYLGIQSQRYDNWSNVFLNEIYLKRFINLLLRKYFDYHQLGQKLIS